MSLTPLPQPLAVFPNFIAKTERTFLIKEKVLSLSGDSFDIKTRDGETMFKVQGKTFTISGRKTLLDVQGRPLLTIRKKHLSLHGSYYADDPSGNRVFDLQGKFSIGTSKSLGKFQNTISGKPEVLSMKGNFFDTKAAIRDEQTGAVVAKIDRQLFNARELLGGQQTYGVTVAPGMDMALIVVMVICLDEKRNDTHSG